MSLESTFLRIGVADVFAFVKDQRREDLTLDFKLAPSCFANRDDRKTLAVGIAGFANSSGGLIIWGVDARKDEDGIDCAQSAVPVPEPNLFMSRLEEHAGAAASPVVAGVQHRLIEGDGGPFAMTLVPESLSGPHMSKLGEDRYYKRSGDQFRRMEHFDVADMFGRRRKPVLALDLRKESGGANVMVSVKNVGRGIAKAPYLALRLPPGFRGSGYGFDGNGRFGLRHMGETDRICRFGASAGEVIHPGQILPVTQLQATVMRTDGAAIINGPQTFKYELVAEDCEMASGEVVLDY
jgi:hypothetical protein